MHKLNTYLAAGFIVGLVIGVAAGCANASSDYHVLDFRPPSEGEDKRIQSAAGWMFADAAEVPNNPVRVSISSIDLNDDGVEDHLVRLSAQVICANAGCPLLILRQEGKELTLIQKIYTDEPVAVSATKHNGYSDLVLNATSAEPTRCIGTWNGAAYDTSNCKL